VAGVRPPVDRGAGLFSTVAGVVVFVVFLLFAVQLLFGLYATSAVSAVANDAAVQAAAADAPPTATIEQRARASLGEVGDTASFAWSADDADHDGQADTVVLEVVARPPRFVPGAIGGAIGLDEIRRTVRVRVEEPHS
jgi:hypothetical protein